MASENASSAHVKSNMRGSRWVAAERTAGVVMNTAAATAPATMESLSLDSCACAPRIRQLTKVATSRKSSTTASAPHMGASTLDAPNSFANTSISGYSGASGTSRPRQHTISLALSPGNA